MLALAQNVIIPWMQTPPVALVKLIASELFLTFRIFVLFGRFQSRLKIKITLWMQSLQSTVAFLKVIASELFLTLLNKFSEDLKGL